MSIPSNDIPEKLQTDIDKYNSHNPAIILFLFMINLIMIASIIAGILIIQGQDLPSYFFSTLGISSIFIVGVAILSNKNSLANPFLNASLLISSLLITMEGLGINSNLDLPFIAFSVVSIAIVSRIFLLDKLAESLIKTIWQISKGLGKITMSFLQQIPSFIKTFMEKYRAFIAKDPLTALEYHLFAFGILLLIIEILPIPQIFPIKYWTVAAIFLVFSFIRDAYVLAPQIWMRFVKSVQIIYGWLIQFAIRAHKYSLVHTILGLGILLNWKNVPSPYQIPSIVLGTFFLISFNQFWLLRTFDRMNFYFFAMMAIAQRYTRFFIRHFVNLRSIRVALGLFNSFIYFIFTFTTEIIPWWTSLVLSYVSFSLAFDETTKALEKLLKKTYQNLQNQRVLAYIFGYLFLFMGIFSFWIPDFPYARLLVTSLGLILLATVNKFFRFWIYTLPKNIVKSIFKNMGGIGKWFIELIEAIITNIFLVLSFFLGIAGILFGLAFVISGVFGFSWIESILPNLPELQTMILGGMMIALGILIPRYTYARRDELRLSGIDMGGSKP